MIKYRKSFYIISLVILLVVSGTFGFVYIEGWQPFDAFYMTIITLTTTGYQEVHPLSQNGRIFTVLLLMIGMGIVAYSISALMSEILSIDFGARRRKKMENRIRKMEGHAIVCGFGRMGRVMVEELDHAQTPFVVIASAPNKKM